MDQESKWIMAIKEDELPEGEKTALLLEGNKVLLLKKEGVFFAMSNKCPHMECPLSKGTLEQYLIVCPCHDWKFDIRNGEFLNAKEIKVPVYQTKVEDGNVFVNMGGAGE